MPFVIGFFLIVKESLEGHRRPLFRRERLPRRRRRLEHAIRLQHGEQTRNATKSASRTLSKDFVAGSGTAFKDRGYFAGAGNAGSLPMSRMSC
jgi:hypothetical protein